MIDFLNNTQFPLTCPSCRNTFNKRFRELETKGEVLCPKCRAPVPVDRNAFKAIRKGRGKTF